MSAAASTTSPDTSGRARAGFLSFLILGVCGWAVLVLGFILAVDPYGVSPVSRPIVGFNAAKPKRRNVDRLIKPVEVWHKQPRTVFLGTSRIHESIDPAVLAGSPLAPAYNASVPAVSLGMNVAYLDLYGAIAPSIRDALVELYLYNFVGQAQDAPAFDRWTVARNAAALSFSGTALTDAIATLTHNLRTAPPVAHVGPGGNFVYPPTHDPTGTYLAFPAGMWRLHGSPDRGLALNEAALASIDRLAASAARRGMGLTFLATPNHAYFDYYLDAIDGWPVLEEWLTRLTQKVTVISFAQPNAWTEERPDLGMRYWNDPIHFSLEFGRAMQLALLGTPDPAAPANLMVRLTPENVKAHVAERRAAIREWTKRNLVFALTFENARPKPTPSAKERIAELSRLHFGGADLGRVGRDALEIDGERHPLAARFAGSVEMAAAGPVGFAMSGWAADQVANRPVKAVVATLGDKVVARVPVTSRRRDIEDNVAGGANPAAFSLVVPVDSASNTQPIRVFALMADGSASRLASGWAAGTRGQVEDYSSPPPLPRPP